jgi:hypothetical protein
VKRLLVAALLSALIASSLGCNGVFTVSGFSRNHSIITGTVSVVELSTVIDGGVFVTVTFVTLVNNGSPIRNTFCGDQTAFFPMNQFVTTTFTPGTPCLSVLQIVVG